MKTKKSKISKNIVCGIFAVILALSLTGCGGGTTDGDDDGDGDSEGRLTVTDLPSSGEWNVAVVKAGTDVSTIYAAGMNLMAIGPDNKYLNYLVFDEKNSGNVFDLKSSIMNPPWTGQGSFPVILQQVVNNMSGGIWTATVNFSNGNATVPFSSFTKVTN